MKKSGIKVISTNRKARHDYLLLETYEAGLVLTGPEIKSVRANKVSLRHSYVQAKGGELWLFEANIAVYERGGYEKQDPTRPRKLLLRKREVEKIMEALATKGLTMVPTKLYLRGGWAKVEVALARGKKQYDKRQALARRDAGRQVERALKEKYRA
jgi:SsrA-binding protein